MLSLGGLTCSLPRRQTCCCLQQPRAQHSHPHRCRSWQRQSAHLRRRPRQRLCQRLCLRLRRPRQRLRQWLRLRLRRPRLRLRLQLRLRLRLRLRRP
jgi:hypothetical protein